MDTATEPQALTANFANELKRAFNSQDIFQRNNLTPDDYQAELLACRHNRYLVLAGRQVGKSETACSLSAQKAYVIPDSTIILISPSDRQSKENVRRCQSLIRNANYGDELKLESQSILHFKNGSRIVGLPGGRPENIRGYSKVSLIVADEAAFIDDETFAATFPFLATNPHAVFIALTTPNGARGWFYRQWSEENNWRKIRVTSEMCSRISPEFLEQQRRELGPSIFSQEYETSFLISESRLIDPSFLSGKFQPMGRL